MIDHNHLDIPAAERSNKAFATLAAQLALQGHQLVRSEAADGAVTYFVTRWGLVRHLPDLDDVKASVRQIGGHHAR